MQGFGAAMQGRPTAPAEAPAPADPAAPRGQAEMAQGEPASPEEQAIYDKFVSLALLHIHDGDTAPAIVEQMGRGDPVEAIGNAAAQVAFAVMQKAEQAGEKVPPDVLLHGGKEVVEALVEVAETAGVADLDQEQTDMAFYQAADTFQDLMKSGGGVDPAAAEDDFVNLMQGPNGQDLQRVLGMLQQARQEESV